MGDMVWSSLFTCPKSLLHDQCNSGKHRAHSENTQNTLRTHTENTHKITQSSEPSVNTQSHKSHSVIAKYTPFQKNTPRTLTSLGKHTHIHSRAIVFFFSEAMV